MHGIYAMRCFLPLHCFRFSCSPCGHAKTSIDAPRKHELTDNLQAAQLSMSEHEELAKECIDDYRAAMERARADVNTQAERTILDISFDFAKSIGLPKFSVDISRSVWTTKLACRVFDVVDNATNIHHFFSFTEFEASENSDVVVSCVWFFLEWWVLNVNNGVWPRELVMHADNSAGQNKNRKMTGFMAWLLASGRVQQASLNFMVRGHTKFSPDRGFAVLKTSLRGRNLYCVDDVIDCVLSQHAAWLGFYMHMTPDRLQAWDSVSSLFEPIDGIRQYHSLHGFSKAEHGMQQVFCNACVHPNVAVRHVRLCSQYPRRKLRALCEHAFSDRPHLRPSTVPSYRVQSLLSFLSVIPARKHAAFLPPDIHHP